MGSRINTMSGAPPEGAWVKRALDALDVQLCDASEYAEVALRLRRIIEDLMKIVSRTSVASVLPNVATIKRPE